MRLSKYASVVCVAACAVMAQDLAPEVLLLSRIKSHLRYEFAHLPNYTCLETIARFQKAKQRGLMPRRTHSANATDQSNVESWQGGKFSQVDTVRLEVACSDHHEWYCLPGAQKLSEENPAALAGGVGLISNGSFSTTLHNLFMVDGATFTSRGEDSVDGRKAVKFDYRFPAGSIIARISLLGGQGAVNEEGSFWVIRNPWISCGWTAGRPRFRHPSRSQRWNSPLLTLVHASANSTRCSRSTPTCT